MADHDEPDLSSGDGMDDEAEPMSLGRRAARVFAIVSVIVVIGLWSYALFGPTQKHAPGHLSDPSFPEAAQPICASAAAAIAALPPAYSTSDPAERAAVIARANASLTDMLDRLDTTAPPAGSSKDADMIAEWLADWRTYLGDRERYADALRTDAKARFYVSTKDRQQITKPIDFFTNINHMLECATPTDVI